MRLPKGTWTKARPPPSDWLIPGNLETTFSATMEDCLEAVDGERGMRFSRRPEFLVNARMQFDAGTPREIGGLFDLLESQDVPVKSPAGVFPAGRHGEPHMVDQAKGHMTQCSLLTNPD